jgi:hypothetical protein
MQDATGGNVISRHNEIRDMLADLASMALIRNEPLIHTSCPADKMSDLDQANPPVTRNLHKNRDKLRGDLLIRGFWGRGTDCIIDVRYVSRIPMRRAISPRTRQGPGSSRKGEKEEIPYVLS